MKITSGTGRDAAIIHCMQKEPPHFKIVHARYACLCFLKVGLFIRPPPQQFPMIFHGESIDTF